MNSLFHITNDNKLTVMSPYSFDNEGILQELIQNFPSILDGDQFLGAEPRQWILVAREMAVPDCDGPARWSLDHLLLDQDEVPTLIEVKRRKDGRSRREVIGQMFDYAANGPAYWPIETLKTCFEKSCGGADEANKKLEELLQDRDDPSSYWDTVAKNLRNGRIRLIFLLDDVPPELLRIIEFLGCHFRAEVEVYAVEVRQHVGDTGKILTTRVIGTTSTSTTAPRSTTVVNVTIDEWLTNLRARINESAAKVAIDLAGWMRSHGELFTTAAKTPALAMSVLKNGPLQSPFSFSPAGKENIAFCYLAYSE